MIVSRISAARSRSSRSSRPRRSSGPPQRGQDGQVDAPDGCRDRSLVRGGGTESYRRRRGFPGRCGAPGRVSGRVALASARVGDRLERTAGPLHEPLHAQLRVGQQPRAVLVQGDAALVEDDRLLQRLAAGFQLGHGRLQLLEGAVERQARRPRRSSVVVIGCSLSAWSTCAPVFGRRRLVGVLATRSSLGARSIPTRIPMTATTAASTTAGRRRRSRGPRSVVTPRRVASRSPRPGARRAPSRPGASAGDRGGSRRRRAGGRSRSRGPASPAGPSTPSAAPAALQPRPRRREPRVERPAASPAPPGPAAARPARAGPAASAEAAPTPDRRHAAAATQPDRPRASPRSSRTPARSRIDASCAVGLSRSSARRSAAASRAAPRPAGPARSTRSRRSWAPSADGDLHAVRRHQLGGRRRRRCPDVGREVGQRDVDLVADAADDGHGMADDGPDDGLVVERPEVLQRTATAGEDRHAAGPPPARPSRAHRSIQRPTRSSAATIDAGAGSPWTRHGDEQHARQRPAPRDHVRGCRARPRPSGS